MLNAVMLTFTKRIVIMMDFDTVSNNMLCVIVLRAVKLTVVFLKVMTSVVMLSVAVSRVMAPKL